MMMSKARAAMSNQNFTPRRYFETSGMSCFSRLMSPKRFSLLFRWRIRTSLTSANIGISTSK